MSGFSFRLQKILDLRKVREKEAMIQLGLALGHLGSEEETLKSLHCQRALAWNQLHDRLRARSEETADPETLIDFIGTLDARIVSSRERIRQAEEAVAVARGFSDERRKDAAIIEKLREHALEEFRVEGRRQEGRVMDEVASSRHTPVDWPGEDG